MKKRILQFIGSFHQGGSELQAVSLTRLLQNEGSFEIYCATLNNDGILRAEMEEIGLPEIPEFLLTSFFNANFVRQVRRCAKHLRDNKIDLVHTHDFYTNVFGMAAATLGGVPVRVASKRETGAMRSSGQEFVEKLAFRRADSIVVNSSAVHDRLTRRGISAEKICTIYNGLDLERFAAIDRDRVAVCQYFGLPADEDIRVVTLVANLRHVVKNVPMLLRTAKRVLQSHPKTHFVIAGEGELEPQLKDLTASLGIADNVHFIGRCLDIPALLSVSYACVLTSTAEGFSNSILEYMATGKPVIATNVGGAKEAIADSKTGYLVASDDDAAMAARLIELLDDTEKASRFGIDGKRLVRERFSQTAQLDGTIALYNTGLKN
ncbi:MAG: glycosyltransferase [Pyrinomonadaceae bacterium]